MIYLRAQWRQILIPNLNKNVIVWINGQSVVNMKQHFGE